MSASPHDNRWNIVSTLLAQLSQEQRDKVFESGDLLQIPKIAEELNQFISSGNFNDVEGSPEFFYYNTFVKGIKQKPVVETFSVAGNSYELLQWSFVHERISDAYSTLFDNKVKDQLASQSFLLPRQCGSSALLAYIAACNQLLRSFDNDKKVVFVTYDESSKKDFIRKIMYYMPEDEIAVTVKTWEEVKNPRLFTIITDNPTLLVFDNCTFGKNDKTDSELAEKFQSDVLVVKTDPVNYTTKQKTS